MKIPEGWPTSGMVQAAFVEAMKRRMIVDIEDISAICKAVVAAVPTPPDHEAEPVGALVGCHDGCGTRIAQEVPLRKQPSYTVTTTHPDSELRKAAEDVANELGSLLDNFDWGVRYGVLSDLRDKLRAALGKKL